MINLFLKCSEFKSSQYSENVAGKFRLCLHDCESLLSLWNITLALHQVCANCCACSWWFICNAQILV